MGVMAGLDAESADAVSSGYTMALVWCRRCDVGEQGMTECWLCGSDELYRWGPSAGAFKFYPISRKVTT